MKTYKSKHAVGLDLLTIRWSIVDTLKDHKNGYKLVSIEGESDETGGKFVGTGLLFGDILGQITEVMPCPITYIN